VNPGYISAISALAGSSIGAMASVGTAWLTQKYQDRSQRLIQESARREKIFGDFLEEASKQYGEALASEVSSPAALVDLYAVIGMMRLFASPETLAAADRLLRVIAATYQCPPADLSHADLSHDNIHDLVREFTECCRADLTHAAILRGGKDHDPKRRPKSNFEGVVASRRTTG
jgi:predicted acylesterase/phospholipase RssA